MQQRTFVFCVATNPKNNIPDNEPDMYRLQVIGYHREKEGSYRQNYSLTIYLINLCQLSWQKHTDVDIHTTPPNLFIQKADVICVVELLKWAL